MKMTKCPERHIYDADKYETCPICAEKRRSETEHDKAPRKVVKVKVRAVKARSVSEAAVKSAEVKSVPQPEQKPQPAPEPQAEAAPAAVEEKPKKKITLSI